MKHRLLTVGLSSLLGLTFALRVAAAATTPAAPPPEKPFEETTDVVAVEVPVNLTDKQKKLLKEFEADSDQRTYSPESTSFFDKVKEFIAEVAK